MYDSKLDNAAVFQYQSLIDIWPWSIDDLLEDNRYTIIRNQYSGYSEQLTDFFSLAQMELFLACNTFNNRIGQYITPSESQSLTGTVQTLEDFNNTIKMYGIGRMTVNPPNLLEKIRSDYFPLLSEKYTIDIPSETPKIGLFVLGATATFGLVDNAGNPLAFPEDVTTTYPPSEDAPVLSSDPLQDSRKDSVEDAQKKIYSVFISSTYEDLRPVRQAVMKQLQLTEEYNPIGMEAFPAADKKQLDYIKEKMEFVDLYVLILGGRYGSLIPDGTMSYSQKEYEMARDRPGIKTLAFICRDPEDLPSKYRDDDSDSKAKLTRFRKELESTVMVRMWNHTDSPEEIASMVYFSLNQADKTNLQGWVRGPVPSV